MTTRTCIRDGCGKPFDANQPETREAVTLRTFWMRYCPEHRVDGQRHEPIVAVEAEWNCNRTAEMSEEQNLRNTCRRIEQQYVAWKAPATFRGSVIGHEWPAIGELRRMTTNGVKVRFVTTKKRSIQIRRPNGEVVAEFKMKPGLAAQLYPIAGEVAGGES